VADGRRKRRGLDAGPRCTSGVCGLVKGHYTLDSAEQLKVFNTVEDADMPFEGSCHCGAVRFEVDAQPPQQAISCNCSHCRRKGFLLSFFPAEQFTLLQGEEALFSYRFNTHKIEHRFCRHCGTQPFAEGANPDGTAVRAVNLRCVPSIDLDALTLQRFDGAAA